MENVITPEQKKAAYVALTDTLSLEQMQLLNTVMDTQEVCPNCRHTYPDSTALDEPLHPRYVAGYKAGHKAGRAKAQTRDDGFGLECRAIEWTICKALR